ncbi:MAG: DUF1538 domain-containing protein [Pseudomonadota bacterium]
MEQSTRIKLGLRDTLRIIWPYVKSNFTKQLKGIWFIVAYLIFFQLFILQLPVVYAVMIALGVFIVAVGLMFFMEGLRLGLMPLGEVIGSTLPKQSHMATILLFAFLLGLGATFAEPAIAVLKAAGKGVVPEEAPLLYSLLNDFSGELVMSVGAGVGIAVMLGVLRFFYAWPLKYLAIPAVALLLTLSFFFNRNPILADVLGLAWDCGAVTTGPVTVPLVLALGIGVCRVVSSGSGDSSHSGFGIVTLASLFPILAVLLLALFHYNKQDYYGAVGYAGPAQPIVTLAESAPAAPVTARPGAQVSDSEYEAFVETGVLPEDHSIQFRGGRPELVDGKIVLTNPQVIIDKHLERSFEIFGDETWDHSSPLLGNLRQAFVDALRAIVPLCIFLYVVLRLLLRKKLGENSDVGVGVVFALSGMTLFGLGIILGLTPLGSQLGGNIPLTFASIVPWGMEGYEQALFSPTAGKLAAVGFAFFLGYGATLAEPALNALGDTVEKITVGAFRKKLLMQSVAIGVGLGIAAGIVKMVFDLQLFWMLMPAYALVLVLTWFSPHGFVNFGWDSAGVTTGPITVPLVLAMGLGIGGNIPGVSDGFGILALASVGPILTVLTVGLYTQHVQRAEELQTSRELDAAAALELAESEVTP